MNSMTTSPFADVKVIFFDFMGTLLDWHSNIVQTLPDRILQAERSRLAIAWREAFFQEIHSQFEQRLPTEDIDITHARCLETVLATSSFRDVSLSDDEQAAAVNAWHSMTAWPDVPETLQKLQEKCEVFILANGTTRLQLDLARSSGLSFDMMFSSQLLGLTKPDPEIYYKALDLVGVEPHNALMVAAHAYDLRAARAVGMKTAYIRRWTEDTTEDFEQVVNDVDAFVGSSVRPTKGQGQPDGKLSTLLEELL
jgi:2-haloalkanoic acid dehalogenase type II